VGFCLVVGDLREYSQKVRSSEWYKAVRASPLVRQMADTPESKRFAELEGKVRRHLHVGFDRLRDDILGDAVVFAYRPGPPGKPQGEQGVVLVWARDPRLLGRVIDLLNGDVRLAPRRHRGAKYYRRAERNGKVNYYYHNGPVLAFSSQEALIREVIGRSLEQRSRAMGKAGGTVFEQLRRLGADKALLALWFNPRAFDAHLEHHVKAAQGPEAFVLGRLLGYWKAMEGAALAVSVHKDVEVNLAVRAHTDRLPPAARRFFEEASKASELWGRFPADALVATAGCIDAAAFSEFLGDFVPAPARKAGLAGLNRGLQGIGLDLERDILPALGPDLGFSLTAPADKKVLIPSATWALRVRPGPNPKKPVDQFLVNGLNSLAFLAVLTGPHGIRLRSATQDKVEVKYLDSKDFPPGFQPAYALKDGYLLLTSSPEAVRTFVKRAAGGGVGRPAPSAPAADVPLLRVSLRAWAQFLKDRREAFVGYAAAKDNVSTETAAQKLDALLWALGLFDRLELRQRTGSGMVTWSLLLRPPNPKTK
jgi:hypothetical protein